jgi:hypothetical protein
VLKPKLLKFLGLLTVFIVSFVATGLLPLVPLRQGRVVIGRLPLLLVWYPSHPLNWPGMGIHLLLSVGVVVLFVFLWQRRNNIRQFSLRTLLLVMTVTAILLGIYAISSAF